MFIRNQWYVAAWDYEIGRKPLARTICGESIVFYRKLDGSVVALHDVCPHRLLPLSMGTLEDDNIRCRYHGMVFDGAGQCVEMPAQERAQTNFCVKKVYRVAERHHFIWVWIGDEDKCDPALMPDLKPCEDPAWTFDGGVYHMKCDYRLVVDNLLDLSHETYVHPSTIGQPEIVSAPIETKTENDRVYVTRWMRDINAPPFWRFALKKSGKVDRWQICEFSLPSAVTIDVGVAPVGTGAPEGDRSQGVTGMVVNLMTPETETSTWYFWGMARNFDIGDSGFTRRFKEQQGFVFGEDVEVLEAQQRCIEENPDMRLRVFNIDTGGAHARVLIDKALKAQAAEAG